MEDEPTIVPGYETSTFEKATGFIAVAMLLTVVCPECPSRVQDK